MYMYIHVHCICLLFTCTCTCTCVRVHMYMYMYDDTCTYLLFFLQVFEQMWLNKETRIAQVANIKQLPPGPTALHPFRRMR